MSTVRYNIALIGKTGIGKSTLVNKLVGMNAAKVGIGRPVTEQGFHCYDCDCDGVPITVHDSWGLEANKIGRVATGTAAGTGQTRPEGSDCRLVSHRHLLYRCRKCEGGRFRDRDDEVPRR